MKNKLWKGLKPKILKNNKENNLFFSKSEENPKISWRFRDFFISLPSLNIIERFAPGAVKDARVTTQGIFYVHTSETCQRSHYTNSGGHPVDISPRTKSMMFSDREGCRFLCLIGEGAPRREAGGNKREVRKDPYPKAWPAFLSWGECSGREAELEDEP